jgi:1,4-alpha-glucan branching enzyme
VEKAATSASNPDNDVAMVFLHQIQDRNNTPSIINRTASAEKIVLFTLDMPHASNVALIGTFNQWTPEGYRMYRDDQHGVWKLSIPLGSGRYEYAFLVDGKIVIADPKGLLQRDDGFGNKNSILTIQKENGHETAT